VAQNPETRIQNSCLLEVGSRPDVLAWRQHVGKYRAINQPELVVSIGVPGMADIGAVVAVTIDASMVGKTVGVYVGAEVKTATGRQRPGQADWQAALERRGGIYGVVRSPEDMAALVARVKNGDW
jgi:hypothetical protein